MYCVQSQGILKVNGACEFTIEEYFILLQIWLFPCFPSSEVLLLLFPHLLLEFSFFFCFLLPWFFLLQWRIQVFYLWGRGGGGGRKVYVPARTLRARNQTQFSSRVILILSRAIYSVKKNEWKCSLFIKEWIYKSGFRVNLERIFFFHSFWSDLSDHSKMSENKNFTPNSLQIYSKFTP